MPTPAKRFFSVLTGSDPEPVELLTALQLLWQALFIGVPGFSTPSPNGFLLHLVPSVVWGFLLGTTAILMIGGLTTESKNHSAGSNAYNVRRYLLLISAVWFTLVAIGWGSEFTISQRLGGFGLVVIADLWAFYRLTERLRIVESGRMIG